MNRLHWNSSGHQHCRLSISTLENCPVAGRNRPEWVRFCVGAMTGIMIMISSTAANAQYDPSAPARMMKEGVFPGLDIWSISQPAKDGAAKRGAPQLEGQQQEGQQRVEPAAKQASLVDVDQELVDQLAELRSSLGGGISPILGGSSLNPQDLEIIFVDEIKRLAKQQTQPQEPREQLQQLQNRNRPLDPLQGVRPGVPGALSPSGGAQGQHQFAQPSFPGQQNFGWQNFGERRLQPQQPQAFHQQNRGSDQPIASERMLRPIQANLQDEPRRSPQNPETKTILRRSARLLEQAAAELEEASRFRDADQLRQQASRLWKDAR